MISDQEKYELNRELWMWLNSATVHLENAAYCAETLWKDDVLNEIEQVSERIAKIRNEIGGPPTARRRKALDPNEIVNRILARYEPKEETSDHYPKAGDHFPPAR